jgi:hypothetical protein
MLHVIQKIRDPLVRLVADDPVRPDIPVEFRVSDTSEIFVLLSDDTGEPTAVVCVAYRDAVPADVYELAQQPQAPSVAVFYTIWSYQPGAGRRLIVGARGWIEVNRPYITEFVTLSPPTDMARRFHLTNGAEVFRVNPYTVNYLYP